MRGRGWVKMRGRKHLLLGCRCCVAFNEKDKELEVSDRKMMTSGLWENMTDEERELVRSYKGPQNVVDNRPWSASFERETADRYKEYGT